MKELPEGSFEEHAVSDWTAHLPRDRPTSRLLVVDQDRRLLLFRASNEAEPDQIFWFTPGGGVEPGESYEQGARRELWEETGLTVEAIGPWVWRRDRDFQGIRFRERYFVVYTETFEPVPGAPDPEWECYMLEDGWYRWWPHDQLVAYRGPECLLPPDLVKLLPPILDGRLPDHPLELMP
jgi:8-oxo-dGTP pyrophosphatase MutT (NUDIX family)